MRGIVGSVAECCTCSCLGSCVSQSRLQQGLYFGSRTRIPPPALVVAEWFGMKGDSIASAKETELVANSVSKPLFASVPFWTSVSRSLCWISRALPERCVIMWKKGYLRDLMRYFKLWECQSRRPPVQPVYSTPSASMIWLFVFSTGFQRPAGWDQGQKNHRHGKEMVLSLSPLWHQ